MEEVSVACGLRCFICGRPETEIQKLSKGTQKGHAQILPHSESVDSEDYMRTGKTEMTSN